MQGFARCVRLVASDRRIIESALREFSGSPVVGISLPRVQVPSLVRNSDPTSYVMRPKMGEKEKGALSQRAFNGSHNLIQALKVVSSQAILSPSLHSALLALFSDSTVSQVVTLPITPTNVNLNLTKSELQSHP